MKQVLMDGKISSKERAIEHVSNQPVKKQAPPQRPAGDLVKYITDTDLFKALDEPAIRYIEAELEWVHLAQGEMLFQPGDYGDWETRFGLFQPGDCADCMYVVVAGRLGVVIIHPDGHTEILKEVISGATFGEMGLFTGQRCTKGICALEDTDLVKLSKSGFDRLIEKFPQVMIRFSEIMTPRLRQIQLTSAFNNLFGSLGELALQHLEPELEWQRIYNGDILMRQGDDSDSMYIVVSGRLNVVARQQDGSQRLLAEVGPGECIGELALLTGEPQAASVCAIRDTVVVRLAKVSFDHLIEQYPQVMVQFMPRIVHRLRQSDDTTAPVAKKTATIAIIPTGRSVLLSKFVRKLIIALSSFGSTLHLNSNCFNSYPGQGKTAQISKDHPASLALETWLSEQETIHRYLVYEADPDWTPWTRRCIRNADRILILGWAEGEPKLSEIEHRMQQMAPLAPRELVLLHPKMTARPRETRQWLAGRQVQTHHHIRLNHVGDLQRLARQLTGHAVGLVLGGGVARALAHIGVIRAIREACLPVDIIGGTSLGAIVAAAYALGWDNETMVQAVKTFITPRQIFDPTLPLVSLANSHKASKTLATQFDGMQIEDLWLPFFCISSNLTRARPEIQRRGALWKHLRASCSLPGIFTPVVEAGDLLVDGALMNNLPVDVMRDLCQSGPVIAVDVSAETDLTEDYQFRASLSGWKVMWSKLNPFSPEIKVPGLFDTLRRSIELNGVHQKQVNKALADLCINPPVAQFGSGEFEAYETLIEVGYQSAQAAIGTWLNKQMEIWNQKYRPGLAD